MGSWREYYRRNRNAMNDTDIFSIPDSYTKKENYRYKFQGKNFLE
jgi:hypothetical protein